MRALGTQGPSSDPSALLKHLFCLALGAAMILAPARTARACGGYSPPVGPMPLQWSVTATLTKISPVTIIGPTGTFDIPVIVNVAFAGPGACPPLTSIVVDLTAFTVPPGPPVGTGTVTITPGAPGPNSAMVTLSPIAPPFGIGQYQIIGTAKVNLADGTQISSGGDTVVCIVEPAPGNPGVPRLDLQLITPPFPAAHPGDQSTHEYKLTNNDPTESYTGMIEVSNESNARLPILVIPGAAGGGTYSPAAPLQGDNFPLQFEDLLPPSGCIPLPALPQDPTIPTISRTVTLVPGESQTIRVTSRSWGMCGAGSSCEQIFLIDGTFSDATSGTVCGGAGVLATTAAPPSYLWPDSGKVTQVIPVGPGQAVHNGQPSPSGSWQLQEQSGNGQLIVAGSPVPASHNIQTTPLNQDSVRTTDTLTNPLGGPLFPGPTIFMIDTEIVALNLVSVTPITVQSMQVVPGEPFGFQSVTPFAMGVYEMDEDGDGLTGSLMDVFSQLHGDALLSNGTRPDLEILSAQWVPGPMIDQFHAIITARAFNGGGPPPNVMNIRLARDTRGYARRGGPDCAPNDPATLIPPPEVQGVLGSHLGGGTAQLNWGDLAPMTGPSVTYNVYRGLLSSLSGLGYGTCLAQGLGSPTFTDPAIPATGDGYFYIMTGENSCGESTKGFASSGSERLGNFCP